MFEQHIPERVRLPQHPIRVGSQVVSRDDDDSPTFEVIAIEDGVATLVQVRDADGAYVQRSEHGLGEQERAPLDSLVVISEFGEPVLPGFRHLGSIERGGDKPYHVVINGENHHALEALRFTHAGKVDCIYIDPPYNSGARDWKYNNDYVDDDRRVPPQQVARVHGAPPQARQGAAEPGRLGAHRHDRREGVPAPRAAAGADVSGGARIQMVSIVDQPAGHRRDERVLARRRVHLLRVVRASAAVAVPIGDVERRSRPTVAVAIPSAERSLDAARANGTDHAQFYPIYVDRRRRQAHRRSGSRCRTGRRPTIGSRPAEAVSPSCQSRPTAPR